MKPVARSPAGIPLFSLLLFLLFFLAIVSGDLKTWPELVGKRPEEAEKVIKKEMPTAKIQVMKYGESVTQEFSPYRVRLFLDLEGKIAYPPRVG
ncbi:hypothetical protein HPP92_018646 [Vanilla planifolia]|uniref:Uncharacterized protein n=1 Tax=Vanilla planifolia TaxID=51239 RepID=A0A835QDC6_VANPL|nr:hypothetical protein HPP92_018646 [Vanilla planifolia]